MYILLTFHGKKYHLAKLSEHSGKDFLGSPNFLFHVVAMAFLGYFLSFWVLPLDLSEDPLTFPCRSDLP